MLFSSNILCVFPSKVYVLYVKHLFVLYVKHFIETCANLAPTSQYQTADLHTFVPMRAATFLDDRTSDLGVVRERQVA